MDRFGRHTVRRHGDILRQNRLVLHDLNARCEVADESLPLLEGTFPEGTPGTRPRTPKSSYWWAVPPAAATQQRGKEQDFSKGL